MSEQQKVRVDPMRATDAIVATDQNGVVLIFMRPIYAPGEMDKEPEKVPSSAVAIPWHLAEQVSRIIAEKAAERAAGVAPPPPPPPPEAGKGRLN